MLSILTKAFKKDFTLDTNPYYIAIKICRQDYFKLEKL